jgi:hypothetical protein
MSFDGLLIHTASVLERTYTGRDKANQPTYTWAVIVVSWPSYWERVLTGEYKFDQGNTFDGVVPDYVVFGREPAGIILSETDHRLRYNGSDYTVKRVDPERGFGSKHHLEVLAMKVGTRTE